MTRWSIIKMLSLWVLFPTITSAQNDKNISTCTTLLRRQQLALAAQCFERVARSISVNEKTSPFQRRLKALYLRNAAETLNRHAKLQKTQAARAYDYERAVALLNLIIKHKLCHPTYRCQELKAKLWELTKKIGYAQLTLFSSGAKTAKLTLRGFKYQQTITLKQRWTGKLRPGTYTLENEATGLAIRKKTFTLAPNQTRLLDIARTFPLRPKPKPKPRPVGPWIIGGVGAAVLLGGGALLIVGYISLTDRDTQYTKMKDLSAMLLHDSVTKRKKTAQSKDYQNTYNAYFSAQNRAEITIPLGWIAMGVGTATLIAATIWLGITHHTTTKKTTKTSTHTPSLTHDMRLSKSTNLLWSTQ